MDVESSKDDPAAIFLWTAIGLLLLFVALLVFKQFAGAFIMSVFIYYCTRPLYKILNSYIRYNTLSAALTIVLFITPFLTIAYYTALTAITELRKVIVKYGVTEIQPYDNPYVNFDLIKLFETPELIFEQSNGINIITGLLDYLLVVSSLVGDILLLSVVTLTVTFYLLLHDHKLSSWLSNQMNHVSQDFEDFTTIIDTGLRSIYFGNILNAILTAAIGVTTFVIYDAIAPPSLSIVFPVLLGLLAGVASLVPVVGVKPVYLPTTLYLSAVVFFNKLDPTLYIYPLAFFISTAIIVDLIPDMLLRPYVTGRNIHLGLLLIAYISGPIIFGWYGFFLMPLFAVIFQHYYTLIFPKIFKTFAEKTA